MRNRLEESRATADPNAATDSVEHHAVDGTDSGKILNIVVDLLVSAEAARMG